MRKTLLAISIALLLILLPSSASQRYRLDFLATAVDVNNNTTLTVTTSRSISIGGEHDRGLLTVWFTPAVPAAVSIDFEFAVSYDNGTTWTTGTGADAYLRWQVNTDTTAISSVVVMSYEVQFYGVTHVKLYRIVVGNGAGNCTSINANLAMARR